MGMTRISKQLGFGLISLLVALTIGAFLLAGLFDLWLQTRKTFTVQSALSQVQDNQRMAITLMSNTIQTGGYYPLYQNYLTPAPSPLFAEGTSFPATSASSAAPFVTDQYLSGGSNAQGDTISVRFVADTKKNTNTLDCQGQAGTNGTTYTNTYSVDASGDLQCDNGDGSGPLTIIAGTTVGGNVVSGVHNMVVLYGVDSTSANKSANRYMTASQVSSANLWTNVKSVWVTLNFINPMFGQPGQTTNPYLPISRVIAVNQAAP
jgi:type IV pilus assembly protein PilW